MNAAFEPLEPRRLLAAVSWDGGGGDGLWSNPLNWSGDARPTQNDDVTIVVPMLQRTIIADAGPIRVKSLDLSETLIVNRGVTLSSLGAFTQQPSAQIRINGLVNWAAGQWDSDTPARVQAGGMLNIGSTTDPTNGQVQLDTTLENRGRLAWRGGLFELGPDGRLINDESKSFDISAPSDMNVAVGDSIENLGLIRRGGSAESTTVLSFSSFANAGRIIILRGTVLMQTAGFDNSGTIDVRTGALNIDPSIGESFTNTGAIILGQASSMLIQGDMANVGGTISTAVMASTRGFLDVAGTLTISAGTLHVRFIGTGFATGQEYFVIGAGQRLGTFGAFTRTALPASLTAGPQYSPSGVTVLVLDL